MKKYVSLALLAIAVGILVASDINNFSCVGAIIATILLGVSLSFTYPISQNNWVKLGGFILLFIFGCIVYHKKVEKGSSHYLQTVNNTCSAFFPSRGDYGLYDFERLEENNNCKRGTNVVTQTENTSNTLLKRSEKQLKSKSGDENGITRETAAVVYHIFHLLVYWYMGLLLISFLGQRLSNKLYVGGYWGMWPTRKKRYVFWGYSKRAMMLAKSIHKDTGGKCLIQISKDLAPEDMRKYIDEIEEAGLDWNLTDLDYYEKDNDAKVNAFSNVENHFFISSDPTTNMKLAIGFVDRIKRKEGRLNKVYVLIDEGEICDAINHWADGVNKSGICSVYLMNEQKLIAQEFIINHPMLNAPDIEVDKTTTCWVRRKSAPESNPLKFKVLILGFGWRGRELLKNIVADAQYVDTTFAADIVECAPLKYSRFRAQCPDACKKYELSFYPYNVKSGKFGKWITEEEKEGGKPRLTTYDRIVVCMSQDSLNIETAFYLQTLAKEVGCSLEGVLYACVKDPTAYTKGRQTSIIRYFGNLKSIYSAGTFLNNKIERAAEKLNYFWARSNSTCEGIAEKWLETKMFDRESSRGSAIGMKNILRLLGLQSATNDFYSHLEGRIQYLAETEHLRWMAFHFMRGIRTLEFTPESKLTSANQIKVSNKHAALIKYADLPEMDWKLNGSPSTPDKTYYEMRKSQKNDIDFIINMPSIFVDMDAEESESCVNKKMLERMKVLLRLLKERKISHELVNVYDEYCTDLEKNINGFEARIAKSPAN